MLNFLDFVRVGEVAGPFEMAHTQLAALLDQFGEAALGRRMHDFHRTLLPRVGSIRLHSEGEESLPRSTFAPN